jgi:hypothetical protein
MDNACFASGAKEISTVLPGQGMGAVVTPLITLRAELLV